jgi:hypothetical protein
LAPKQIGRLGTKYSHLFQIIVVTLIFINIANFSQNIGQNVPQQGSQH